MFKKFKNNNQEEISLYNESNENNKSFTQEPNYDEVGFKGFVKKTAHSKWFWPTITSLLIMIIAVLIFRITTIDNGKLKDIKINAPSIIYLGEKTEISATAIGKGNLKNTNFHFNTSNNSIVELETKSAIKGKYITNYLIPLELGKFTLYTNGELDNEKINAKNQEIAICKRFNSSAIKTNHITIEKDKQMYIQIDLGKNTDCFKNIQYIAEDLSIISVNQQGVLTAKNIGHTKVTITDRNEAFTITVNVIPKK